MTELATLAGGCFWCIEAVMRRLRGVVKVTSGYAGGTVSNPTYEQVCSGTSGHAESVQVVFDPNVISYATILDVFLAMHEPTSLNRQGADIGTEYRSAIFFHDENQKKVAKEKLAKIKGAVTEVVPYTEFYPAEIDQQQYYEINQQAGYCRYVIDPKITKLMTDYRELVKSGYSS